MCDVIFGNPPSPAPGRARAGFIWRRDMAKIQYYRGQVVKALKRAGIYDEALSIQINSLASALLTLKIANAEIEGLDSVLLHNETSQGVTNIVHPVFKVQRDAMDQVSRQMKQLGLTTSEVVGKPELPDEADRLLSELEAIK